MVSYNQINMKGVRNNLTNYDIFMMNKNKKKAESKLFGRQNEKPVDISYESYKNKVSQDIARNDDYKTYLMQQLERSSPDKILTEEEFYSQKINSRKRKKEQKMKNIKNERIVEKTDNSVASGLLKKFFGNVRFRKGSKIFIAFYVLIVIAVASILIVTNTASPSSTETVGAVSGEVQASEEVQPMTFKEGEEENQNWFDKLCDSLNK